jgi:CheY-like chemotaxis protein
MKRILLVEDQSDILLALSVLLELDGYGVVAARNGNEAWTILNHERFDLVMTDFDMPGMKGDELARHIEERWPETPVLMLSGSAELLRASECELPGVDALINKAFKPTDFRLEIARLLEEGSRSPSRAGGEVLSGKSQCRPVSKETLGRAECGKKLEPPQFVFDHVSIGKP